MGSMAAQLCIQDVEKADSVLKPRTERLAGEVIVRRSSVRVKADDEVVASYSRYLRKDTLGDEVIYIY